MNTNNWLIRLLLWLFLVHLTWFFAMAWGPGQADLFGTTAHLTPKGMRVGELASLDQMARYFGAALGLPAILLTAWGIWRMDCLLQSPSGPVLLSLENIAHLRAFAGAVAMATLCGIIELPLRGFVFRHAIGIADYRINVGVSSEQWMLGLVCGAFYIVIRMMHEARRIAAENQEFV